jgi:foldase protein PrsA
VRKSPRVCLSAFPALVSCCFVVAALIGCGGAGADRVAVRIGAFAITGDTVEHWAAVMGGGRPSSISAPHEKALRRRALRFLIAADWAIGEAADREVTPSRPEVARRVKEKVRSSFPGGRTEEREFLAATGQTVEDLSFEARAELAAAKLRQALAYAQPAISPARIARFYARNRQLLTVPERRTLDISNRKSAAALLALRREVESGRSLRQAGKHLTDERTADPTRPLERAIYSATRGVLTGPVRQGIDYYLFEVTRITPARLPKLAGVRGEIARRLKAQQLRHALAAFLLAWRGRWRARTNCSPGYVVDGCRQDTGSAEAPLGLP